MNRLAAILPAGDVLVDVDATSKKRVFEQAGLLFENQHAIARATVTDNLFARERLGSTGLGHGVAIPHGRIKGLKNPLAAVLRVRAADRLRCARRRAGRPADLPAGARGGDPAPPRDPLRDRRDALRPRPARAPEDRGRRRRGAPADRRLGAAEVGRLSRSRPGRSAPAGFAADETHRHQRRGAVRGIPRRPCTGSGSPATPIRSATSTRPRCATPRSAADLVGYLNYIHPNRVQIVGRREVAYLNDAVAPRSTERRISRIVTLEPPVLIVRRRAGAAGPAGRDVRPRRHSAVRHRASRPAT